MLPGAVSSEASLWTGLEGVTFPYPELRFASAGTCQQPISNGQEAEQRST